MNHELPPSAEFMSPSYGGGRCKVCGQLIGAEPARIISYPDAVHERCRDRFYQQFPFGKDLEMLRRLFENFTLAFQIIVEEGKWLAASAKNWPVAREDILKEWPERKAKAKVRLEALLGNVRTL